MHFQPTDAQSTNYIKDWVVFVNSASGWPSGGRFLSKYPLLRMQSTLDSTAFRLAPMSVHNDDGHAKASGLQFPFITALEVIEDFYVDPACVKLVKNTLG